jgi:hypothetical protein
MIVVCFDRYVFESCAGNIAEEIVGCTVLFEIEAGDEAVYEAVAVGEMTIEFVDIVEDGAEVAVDGVAVG